MGMHFHPCSTDCPGSGHSLGMPHFHRPHMYLEEKGLVSVPAQAVQGLAQELVLAQELTTCNQNFLEARTQKRFSLQRGKHCHHRNTGCPGICWHHLGKPRSHQLRMFHLEKGLVKGSEMEELALDLALELVLAMGAAMGAAMGLVSHHNTT